MSQRAKDKEEAAARAMINEEWLQGKREDIVPSLLWAQPRVTHQLSCPAGWSELGAPWRAAIHHVHGAWCQQGGTLGTSGAGSSKLIA